MVSLAKRDDWKRGTPQLVVYTSAVTWIKQTINRKYKVLISTGWHVLFFSTLAS